MGHGNPKDILHWVRWRKRRCTIYFHPKALGRCIRSWKCSTQASLQPPSIHLARIYVINFLSNTCFLKTASSHSFLVCPRSPQRFSGWCSDSWLEGVYLVQIRRVNIENLALVVLSSIPIHYQEFLQVVEYRTYLCSAWPSTLWFDTGVSCRLLGFKHVTRIYVHRGPNWAGHGPKWARRLTMVVYDYCFNFLEGAGAASLKTNKPQL